MTALDIRTSVSLLTTFTLRYCPGTWEPSSRPCKHVSSQRIGSRDRKIKRYYFFLPKSDPKAPEYSPHTATAPPTMFPKVTGSKLAKRNWDQDTLAPSAIPRGIKNLADGWLVPTAGPQAAREARREAGRHSSGKVDEGGHPEFALAYNQSTT